MLLGLNNLFSLLICFTIQLIVVENNFLRVLGIILHGELWLELLELLEYLGSLEFMLV